MQLKFSALLKEHSCAEMKEQLSIRIEGGCPIFKSLTEQTETFCTCLTMKPRNAGTESNE